MYNVTSMRVSVTIIAIEKTVSITYSECAFVAFFIKHEMRMRGTTLSSVACRAVPYFTTLTLWRRNYFFNFITPCT